MTKISHEGSKSIFLFYENLGIQLKHIFFEYPYTSTIISGFVSYLTFNITVSQVPFFYYVF